MVDARDEAGPPATEEHREASRPHQLTPAATGFALFLSALWGGNPVAIKAGLDDAPPLRLAWMRFAVGGVVTIVWALWTKQPIRPTRAELRPLGWLALLFVTQIAFMNIGQDHTTASHAVVIGATAPLWTGLIAHFFVPGDRMSPVRSTGALVTYLGVLVVFAQSLGSSQGTLLGDLLMVCSSALLGTRQVYTALKSQSVALPKLLLTQTVVGVSFFFVSGLLLERDAWVISQRLVFSVLYQGGVIAGFGFIGNMWLMKHYLPSGVAAISLTTPVWGVILANVLLGEALSSTLFAGLALVIGGSALSQWSAARRL